MVLVRSGKGTVKLIDTTATDRNVVLKNLAAVRLRSESAEP